MAKDQEPTQSVFGALRGRLWNPNLVAGALLLLFSGSMAGGAYLFMTHRMTPSNDGSAVGDLSIYEAGFVGIVLIIALLAAVMAARTMLSSATPRVVIPEADRELLDTLIREANDKAIDQYVRLSSLSGATGTATKLGLTGLPLATVGLTIFFAVMAAFKFEGFLDLAKLTLGAFIGSFVQRSVTGERAAAAAAVAAVKDSNTP